MHGLAAYTGVFQLRSSSMQLSPSSKLEQLDAPDGVRHLLTADKTESVFSP